MTLTNESKSLLPLPGLKCSPSAPYRRSLTERLVNCSVSRVPTPAPQGAKRKGGFEVDSLGLQLVYPVRPCFWKVACEYDFIKYNKLFSPTVRMISIAALSIYILRGGRGSCKHLIVRHFEFSMSLLSSDQGTTNLFRKEPDSKYFQQCGPYGLCHTTQLCVCCN